MLSSDDDSGLGLDSALTFTVNTSGTYYLGAGSASSSDTGSYVLRSSTGASTDDFAGSTATAGRLSPGGAVTGQIETTNDSDWFAITLLTGQGYTFSLDANGTAGLSDPYLRLYNSAGVLQTSDDDSGAGLDSLLSVTVNSGGTFYLAASAAGSETGSYVLRSSLGTSSTVDDYTASSSTSGRVSPGGSTTGKIETAGDSDWFAISLTAGQRYTFNLDSSTSGGLSDPTLTLRSDRGVALATNDDTNGNNSQISFTATATGTHYLDASAIGSLTGFYTLRASAPVATVVDDFAATISTTGNLASGATVKGRIETVGDNDWFRVSLESGQRYVFDLTSTGSDPLMDPFLTLYSASGAVISTNDDTTGRNSQLNYIPTATGTFYVGARDQGTGLGNYQLASHIAGQTTPSGFSIDIVFSGDAKYQSYFTAAAARWSEVITGDLPEVGLIDDLQISASVAAIDGSGSVLARAGARGIRSDSKLPYSGTMTFDSADIDSMVSKGTFGDVVLHEMGHILGISNYFFDLKGLLDPTNDLHYTGTNALARYQSLTSAANTFVPLEDAGGAGTARSHFDEELFDRELMTGYAENSSPMPLSILTIGILQDLGYQVNFGAADPYSLP